MLPQLTGQVFLSDGGLETSLVFLDKIELPHFAAFTLLADELGRERLKSYYVPYLELCAEMSGAGFVLETPTWRANPDWAALLGVDSEHLRAVNHAAAQMMCSMRSRWAPRLSGPMVVSGVIGPRGDGYVANAPDSVAAATSYHCLQAEALASGGVDMLSAVTMTTSAEALGISLAAQRVGLPVAISFTVETDGRLPSGEALGDAIERVDALAPPAYFAINCAHPSHFAGVLKRGEPWIERIRGLRANASTKSHAELDASAELDIGDPSDLAQRYRGLKSALPNLNIVGGCCGTDWRHLRAVRDAWGG
ncbi:homocysteine S-methyltransferase family protein [Aquabacterium sp. OR-4]|uniref:homocysteine S-methyltransferase family protein n=1 Tax=Aquabacterium sp. OR-4 TaxID=2978127 RepID=UPI0021B23FF3|nr:homocysteine S-methyltransferase family protein [Aquabacterium sp. OR-4]MDT7838427.1 homocysteine S-methyltransferase family protein [Aquabacterium sp. OR-4]